MEMPDFFDIVTVLASEHTRRWGIAGEEGVILGKSTDDGTPDGMIVEYVVSIGDRGSYSVDPDTVLLTGRKARREDFYTGESIRVSADGEYLGPGRGSEPST